MQYLEDEIKNNLITLTVIRPVNELVEQFEKVRLTFYLRNLVICTVTRSGIVGLINSSASSVGSITSKSFFVSGANIWLLRRLIDMGFDAIIGGNDILLNLQKAIIHVMSNKDATFISNNIRAILRETCRGGRKTLLQEWEVLYLLVQGYSL